MPHLHLSYTANLVLDADTALAALNRVLLESGLFQAADIKSRAQVFEHHLVGAADRHTAYAHITLWLLSGRSEETRAALAQQLLTALQHSLGGSATAVQLTVDIQEMACAVYAKAVLPPAP